MSSTVKFVNTKNSRFFATARKRVETYFAESMFSRHANKAMWIKTVFYLSVFFGLYGLIISGQFSPWVMLCLAVLLGISSAFIGFNICHDAIHGSFSGNRRINKVFSCLFNFIGASPYVWSIIHNIAHHTYTNIAGHDEDIEIAPGLIRISDEEKVNKLHKYQHLYAFPLYGLASLSWVFRKDFKKFFQKKIGQHATKHPRKEYFNLFFYKALYYFLFIGLPLLVLNITWWQFLIGFLAMHVAEGLVMGLVFQLAHVVEGTDFPHPDEEGNIEEAWAEHQMRTTANFASKSALASFLLGGLNRQIEHHLFPKVCHIHYPAISVIVKQTAQEFNLPYIENRTFLTALQSHYRVLKKFGKDAMFS